MREIGLEDIKRMQLDILDAVDEFCKKEGISYMLSYGTLLGAVRHKGYIPWDDDIDLMMLRSEYERFVESFRHPVYRVADYRTTPGYFQPYAKVSDSRTRNEEFTTFKTVYGVNIDIFPVDNMTGDDALMQRFQSRKRLINIAANLKMIRLGKRSLWKNIVLAVSHVALAVIPFRFIVRKASTFSQQFNRQETPRAGIMVTYDNKLKWIVDKDIFRDTVLLPFEGRTYPAPGRFDEYLTALYGNYMQLPPEDKRESHHLYSSWWIDDDTK